MYAVGGQRARGWAAAICLLAASLLWVPAASAKPLGSNLHGPADTGICPTRLGGVEAVCTETQLWLGEEGRASERLFSDSSGVITRWWVASGSATPATTGVRLRLRLLRGKRPLAGAATAYEQLPLARPGIHGFPARLPIEWGDRLALDVGVLGSGNGTASAPIAHSAPGIGEVGEWIPPLGSARRPETYHLPDTELLLKAGIEGDLDADGWGDRTQDRCRYDPRRQTPCLPDRRPPRVELRYAKRQSFLDDGRVRARVRSSEFGNVYVAGSVELPSIDTSWIAISSEAWVEPGEWANLFLYMEPPARAAARGELAAGGNPYVAGYAAALDASGNRAPERNLLVRLPER